MPRIGVMRARKDGGYSVCYVPDDKVGQGRCVHVLYDSIAKIDNNYKDFDFKISLEERTNIIDKFSKVHNKKVNRHIEELVIAQALFEENFHNIEKYIPRHRKIPELLEVCKIKPRSFFEKQKDPTVRKAKGFYDGRTCYICEDTSDITKTALHEYYHCLSNQRVTNQYRIKSVAGVYNKMNPAKYLNEGITEYLAQKTLNREPYDKSYIFSTDVVKKLCRIFSEETVLSAYFKNDIKILSSKYEKHFMEHSFNNFMYALNRVTTNNDMFDDNKLYVDSCLQELNQRKKGIYVDEDRDYK